MEVEIELKLFTSGEVGPLIERFVLGALNATVEQQTLVLSNSYFDTAAKDFRKNKMGLRIRGSQQHFEQTIKTAGQGIGGLQQRPEYNVDLGVYRDSAPKLPLLALFPDSIWPPDFDIELAQENLVCQFSTEFTRHIYLLTFNDGAKVELVWDVGTIAGNGHSEPLNEIELELKSGTVGHIFDLARIISRHIAVKIGLLSKAARGYALIDINRLSNQTVSAGLIPAEKIPKNKLYAVKGYLFNWQTLTIAFEKYPLASILAILRPTLVNLHVVLLSLTDSYPRLISLAGNLRRLLEEINQDENAQKLDSSYLLEKLTCFEVVILQLDLMEHLLEIK